MDDEQLLTVREVARRCHRSEETIRRWIWSGKLAARKIGNQHFVAQEDIDWATYKPPALTLNKKTRELYKKYHYSPVVQSIRDDRGQVIPGRAEQWRDIQDDEAFQDELRREFGTVDVVRLIRETREE
jgi:excisionase family DNA binding protein